VRGQREGVWGRAEPVTRGGAARRGALAELKRSAAVRGQRPREEGVRGRRPGRCGELLIVGAVALGLGLEAPHGPPGEPLGERERGLQTRGGAGASYATAHCDVHAALPCAASNSSGVMYPSDECNRWRL
jgi:hypothetical protein